MRRLPWVQVTGLPEKRQVARHTPGQWDSETVDRPFGRSTPLAWDAVPIVTLGIDEMLLCAQPDKFADSDRARKVLLCCCPEAKNCGDNRRPPLRNERGGQGKGEP